MNEKIIGLACAASMLAAQEARIVVHADKVLGQVSRDLTGVCIEDVNHEIYGGLYSQMIFGESFQEPPQALALPGFKAMGTWTLEAPGGPVVNHNLLSSIVSRLVRETGAFQDGAAGVEIQFDRAQPGGAGLVLRANRMEQGLNTFVGYEVWLDPAAQMLRMVAMRPSPENIANVRVEVPVKKWINLTAKLNGPAIEILVDGKSVLKQELRAAAVLAGTVGLRAGRLEASFRNWWVQTGGRREQINLPRNAQPPEISGMWRAVAGGNARGGYSIATGKPFVGKQSQRIAFESGQGQWGVENQGLNLWGMNFVQGRPYEGFLWVRSEKPASVFVALESADGSRVHAERALAAKAGDWQRINFTLTPSAADKAGRFAVKLKQPGSIDLGFAFLQPGEWGRFKGLPVRRDVAEGMLAQGMTVIRYGGSMVNHGNYRWKNMIGPRERRPNHEAFWYPQSTNGWGISDFLAFGEAMGVIYIPVFNMDETPRDMADFIDYAKGPATSTWGKKRQADGHAAPYKLRYIELGNEERIDETYFAKFKPMAEAIWAKDPAIVLVVGDFLYRRRIENPLQFAGASSNITTLAAHRQILELAARNNREVWFDVHVNTEKPPLDGSLGGVFSLIDAFDKFATGAKFKVAVFELNAANHGQKRALANALAINAIERDGRIPIVTSANGLQPDGQNDNAWDQGLLFLNPSSVWLQPPGYVAQMIAKNYLPQVVHVDVTGAGDKIDVTAKRSEDGKTLTLQVVNPGEAAVRAEIKMSGFAPRKRQFEVTELAAPLEAVNLTAESADVKPLSKQGSGANHTFPPHSFTVMRFE